MSSLAVYTIVTICQAGGTLDTCKDYIGFGDYYRGFTQSQCVTQSVQLAEKWLQDNRITNRFVSTARCHLNQQRGA